MKHVVITPSEAKFIADEAFSSCRPQNLFDITPVIHLRDGVRDDRSETFWSATANALYIVRQDGVDIFGPTPEFNAKLLNCPDLVANGRRGPKGCDAQEFAGLELWRAADRATLQDRPSMPAAYHAIGWLPTDVGQEAWREIILQFLDEQIVANGMVADWALHALADGSGGWIKS